MKNGRCRFHGGKSTGPKDRENQSRKLMGNQNALTHGETRKFKPPEVMAAERRAAGRLTKLLVRSYNLDGIADQIQATVIARSYFRLLALLEAGAPSRTIQELNGTLDRSLRSLGIARAVRESGEKGTAPTIADLAAQTLEAVKSRGIKLPTAPFYQLTGEKDSNQ